MASRGGANRIDGRWPTANRIDGWPLPKEKTTNHANPRETLS